MIGLVAAGTLQSFLGLDKLDEKDRAPLAEDEFEVVYYPFHTTIRVGGHEYDYMVLTMRKDDQPEEHGLGHTRIRFKVPKAETKRLTEFLEQEVGSVGLYLAMPYFTSCTSNSLRAVERNTSVMVPAGIDRSPALSNLYFKTRRLLGDTRITRIVYEPATQLDVLGFFKPVIDSVDSLASTVFLADFAVAAQWDRTPWGWSLYRPGHPDKSK